MFLTNIRRIIRSGFVGFWRNGFVALASILVMTVALFIVGFLFFTGVVLNASLDQLRQNVGVNAFFDGDVPEESILILQERLRVLPEVANVTYTSREEALKIFRERNQNNPEQLEGLDMLDENPLPANLTIEAVHPSLYEDILSFLDSSAARINGENIVSRTDSDDKSIVIERLTGLIETTERVSFYVALLFIFISIVITFNTVRLAIYTAREEIAVMKLVGASDGYIRGPFIVSGVLSGMFSALLTIVLFYPLTYWLGPVTESRLGGVDIFEYYLEHFFVIALLLLFVGAFLGVISSTLAVRKYLSS